MFSGKGQEGADCEEDQAGETGFGVSSLGHGCSKLTVISVKPERLVRIISDVKDTNETM